MADVDEGDGLATGVFLLRSLSVGWGEFLFRLDTFPEGVVVEGTWGQGFVVVECIQASFFEFMDEFVG